MKNILKIHFYDLFLFKKQPNPVIHGAEELIYTTKAAFIPTVSSRSTNCYYNMYNAVA